MHSSLSTSAQWTGHFCSLVVSLCFERTNQCLSIVKRIANNKNKFCVGIEIVTHKVFSMKLFIIIIHLIHDILCSISLWKKLPNKLFGVSVFCFLCVCHLNKDKVRVFISKSAVDVQGLSVIDIDTAVFLSSDLFVCTS